MTDTPLAGLRIAITRPRAQADLLAQRIAQLGGHPILFPLLEIEAADLTPALLQQLSRLDGFDLAIFISPNAVHYGLAAIHRAGGLPGQLRIATVGQGSARALRDAGIVRVIAPSERFDSEALLALPELQQVQGWRVMILRGDGGRELLGDTLKARGAQVEYAACYRRSKPDANAASLLQAAPDIVTVSSSEALRHLWDMLDEADKMHIAALPLFVPHARIAEAARQLGWRQVFETAGGDDGLLSGLIAWPGTLSKTEQP